MFIDICFTLVVCKGRLFSQRKYRNGVKRQRLDRFLST
ncbi:hypothetical protein AALB_1323 [Agarivorans albus MKT 106]|uniref:Uncharacterized protein n=1 Tax=Agarivorans albus MKT 106 TaxID=1331007 RepID=R9PJ04_AGAAL|nr:hypothetical protein AALB_1323 [Agarivorans albus MKT 106]